MAFASRRMTVLTGAAFILVSRRFRR